MPRPFRPVPDAEPLPSGTSPPPLAMNPWSVRVPIPTPMASRWSIDASFFHALAGSHPAA